MSFPDRCPGCGLYTIYPGTGWLYDSEWLPEPVRLCDDCGPSRPEAVPVDPGPPGHRRRSPRSA